MKRRAGRLEGLRRLVEAPKNDNPTAAPLLVLVGPTASGKSALAVDLALQFHGEIVNCDSVQLYRGLDIGTAKTTAGQRRGIPHHLLDVLDPKELTTAGDYCLRARGVLQEIASRGTLPIVVGGTGFYLRALLEGLAEGPSRNEPLRARLAEMESISSGRLHRLLLRLDGEAAARIHARDLNKLIRAIEICILSRRPASDLFLDGRTPLEGFRMLKFVLQPDRKALHDRIAVRTRAIFSAGLVDEVRQLLAQGISWDAKPFESIGYREATEFLRGRISLEQAIESTTIATRQYAKRQMTWFRREPDAIAIHGFGDDPLVFADLRQITHRFLANLQA
jgi:tRNA dimethylallyltransferase